MENLIFASVIVAFIATIVSLPLWIKRAKNAGLTGKDMNKKSEEKIAEGGGITVIMGFVLGILAYIAIKTFYFQADDGNIVEIFALLSTILIISFIGMIDDILGWKIGLGKGIRLILVLFATIPLIVINSGNHTIFIPFLGPTNIGLIYILILLPIGIVGASTTFNFLAGYNGLEARQGILILSALGIMAWIQNEAWLSLVSFCMIASLTAFLYYNKYPAKIFPGDVMTYSVGALIAIMAILGNFEMFAVFIFIPYIIETILKARGKLRKESFGEPQEDGSIKNKHNKIYGLEHIAIKILEKVKTNKKAYEKEVVLLINLFQIIIILIGFFIFLH